jgi:hypothetical protein
MGLVHVWGPASEEEGEEVARAAIQSRVTWRTRKNSPADAIRKIRK